VRKIPISLINTKKGERKAHACDMPLVTTVIFRRADLPIKNGIVPKSQLVADGV